MNLLSPCARMKQNCLFRFFTCANSSCEQNENMFILHQSSSLLKVFQFFTYLIFSVTTNNWLRWPSTNTLNLEFDFHLPYLIYLSNAAAFRSKLTLETELHEILCGIMSALTFSCSLTSLSLVISLSFSSMMFS